MQVCWTVLLPCSLDLSMIRLSCDGDMEREVIEYISIHFDHLVSFS